jgi:hypothetical protein
VITAGRLFGRLCSCGAGQVAVAGAAEIAAVMGVQPNLEENVTNEKELVASVHGSGISAPKRERHSLEWLRMLPATCTWNQPSHDDDKKREHSGAYIMSKTSFSARQKPSGTYSDVCGPRTVWRRPTGQRFTQSKHDAAPGKRVEEQRLLDGHTTARYARQASRT